MFSKFNKRQNYISLILALLVAVFCTSCGQDISEEYDDQSLSPVDKQKAEVEYVEDIYDSEDSGSFLDDYTDYTSDEDVSESYANGSAYYEDQVYIPDGVSVVRYAGDREQLFEDMYLETSYLPAELCLVGGSFDRNDFYALPYSGFWITEYTTRTETGTDPVTGDTETYTFYRFTYDDGMTIAELENQKAAVDRAAEEIIAKIPISADTWTQIRVVHDELCRLIRFDESFTKPHRYDAYGALVNHEAVCNGYACAFNHIMSRLAVDTRRIYSDEHAWNYAGVPSNEQYLDITWDDTDYFDQYGNEYVNYAYLFLTLDEMKAVEQHQDLNGETSDGTGYYEPYNYYMHEGYYIYDYSWETFIDMMRRQYETGTNMLTVRFAYEDDYQMAKSWNGSNRNELNDLLRELNYSGSGIYTWYNDELRTMSVGLYAPKQ